MVTRRARCAGSSCSPLAGGALPRVRGAAPRAPLVVDRRTGGRRGCLRGCASVRSGDSLGARGRRGARRSHVSLDRSRAVQVAMGLRFDALSAVMILIVTGVGFLIHVYSVGYMEHDEDSARYFAYLNLFMFSMLILVLGDSSCSVLRRLGGRRALLLPADRLLVREERKRRRREEGVHRQPRRRRRLPARPLAALLDARRQAARGRWSSPSFARTPS